MRLAPLGDLLALTLLATGLAFACYGAAQSGHPVAAMIGLGVGAAVLVWRFSPARRKIKRKCEKRRPAEGRQPAKVDRTPEPVSQRAAELTSKAGSDDVSVSPSDRLVGEMISQGREVLLLRPQIATNLAPPQLARAQHQLDDVMAVVPQGIVMLLPSETDRGADEIPTEVIDVEGLYLDRYLVTNSQFRAFVDAGGYEQMSLWEESIWSAILQFVDKSGHPGPRYWQEGAFPRDLADHPVVGVSWYEAMAYARWVGKRLPTDPEWVKAGVWPVGGESGLPTQRRFPWGDSMDRERAHLWGPNVGGTARVTSHGDGDSVGGVHQLIGNVWEWTSSSFAAWDRATRFCQEKPLKSIRGGAFDTYFDNQASCQFQSGEDPLSRKHNIGFRCAIGLCDLVPVGWDFSETDTASADESDREEVLT